ncbi:cold-shock protein [Formicincola oecophyllae]|uniref:Cold-shock protein n=2 Tax=Formicincola oecophyllae TaxID=2558361 RepID=A0A4Y6UBG3_9PROT|nr:cold-shock protein [Formicincola oecophyllae]
MGGQGGGFGGGRPPRRPGRGPIASGPEVGATVKWFNAERGFGFVGLSDGSGDVFLHANTLNDAGHPTPEPGTTLTVRTGQGPKGRQVAEILSFDASTAEAPTSRPSGPRAGFGGAAPDMSTAQDMRGTVKWYNPTKGFGFITPENGGKDVFIHASALGRSGLDNLADGQQVDMKVAQGHKGPEALSVTPV